MPVDRVRIRHKFHGIVSGRKVPISGIAEGLVAGPDSEVRPSDSDAKNRFEALACRSDNLSTPYLIRKFEDAMKLLLYCSHHVVAVDVDYLIFVCPKSSVEDRPSFRGIDCLAAELILDLLLHSKLLV